MDSLEEKLATILNDPESMARVREMAQSILGDGQATPQQSEETQSIFGSDMPDSEDIKKIIGIMSHLKSSKNDSKAQLLLSLKPHLSKPRQDKVDTAVKILKIIEILPYLKDSGILNL